MPRLKDAQTRFFSRVPQKVYLSTRASGFDFQCNARRLPRYASLRVLGMGYLCSYRIISFSIHITSQYLPNFRPTSVNVPTFLNPNLS